MSCKYTIDYDSDTNRYQCLISGDECIFLIPNEKSCEEAGCLDEEELVNGQVGITKMY